MNNNECSVCYEDCILGSVNLHCKHNICCDCISLISKNKNNFICPICRHNYKDLSLIIINFENNRKTLAEYIFEKFGIVEKEKEIDINYLNRPTPEFIAMYGSLFYSN